MNQAFILTKNTLDGCCSLADFYAADAYEFNYETD